MKKVNLLLVVIITISLFNQSCATMYGGARTECQKERPKKGEQSRALRPGYLTLDILASLVTFGAPLIIDFGTRAIYKPCHKIQTTTITEVKGSIKDSLKKENKTKIVYEKAFQRMGTTGYLDSKNGFKHFFMGTPPSNYPNLYLISEDSTENTKTYKYNGVITLGNYTMKGAVLTFYKNRLYFIHMETEGYVNSMGVLDIFNKAYGKGSQSNRYIKDYYWMGVKVYASLDYNDISDEAKIVFVSRPLSRELKKEKEVRNKKAAGDL